MKKKRFIRHFQRRFLLRFHMSLILMATCLSGALFSRLLLHFSFHDPLLRYPLVAALSYLLFFAFIKIWLWYVGTATRQRVEDSADSVINSADLVDIPVNLPGGGARLAGEGFVGGGGHFGGGGASGSFGDDTRKGLGDKVGDLVPDLDEGAGLALPALGVLLAVTLGAGIYLVYSAPAILSEAAFECLLAGSLVKRSKKMDDPDWVGGVLRTTWMPFTLILATAVAAGWVLHEYFPEVARIADLFGH